MVGSTVCAAENPIAASPAASVDVFWVVRGLLPATNDRFRLFVREHGNAGVRFEVYLRHCLAQLERAVNCGLQLEWTLQPENTVSGRPELFSVCLQDLDVVREVLREAV